MAKLTNKNEIQAISMHEQLEKFTLDMFIKNPVYMMDLTKSILEELKEGCESDPNIESRYRHNLAKIGAFYVINTWANYLKAVKEEEGVD